MTTYCPECKLPRFYGPSGYAGQTCQCTFGYTPYRLWNDQDALRRVPPHGVTVELKLLTEEDVRRIVREELAKAGEVKP